MRTHMFFLFTLLLCAETSLAKFNLFGRSFQLSNSKPSCTSLLTEIDVNALLAKLEFGLNSKDVEFRAVIARRYQNFMNKELFKLNHEKRIPALDIIKNIQFMDLEEQVGGQVSESAQSIVLNKSDKGSVSTLGSITHENDHIIFLRNVPFGNSKVWRNVSYNFMKLFYPVPITKRFEMRAAATEYRMYNSLIHDRAELERLLLMILESPLYHGKMDKNTAKVLAALTIRPTTKEETGEQHFSFSFDYSWLSTFDITKAQADDIFYDADLTLLYGVYDLIEAISPFVSETRYVNNFFYNKNSHYIEKSINELIQMPLHYVLTGTFIFLAINVSHQLSL